MEVEDELKLCEVKRVNLGKAFDKLHSQSSELLLFTLQWRDLEDYLKSVQDKVEKRFVEVESREAELRNRSFEIDERGKVVEAGERRVGELEVKADGFRREIEEKEEELSGVRMLVEEFSVKQRLKASEVEEMVEALRKTQAEVDLKGGELAKMEADLERHRAETNRAQNLRRELDEEIERKTRDLTLVQNKVVECCKLFETRSLELTRTQGELDLKVEQLGHVKTEFERHHSKRTAEMEHLDRIQTRNRDLEEDIERKRKDLAEVLDRTAECGKQLKTRSLELVAKEKELQVLSLDLNRREEMVKSLNNSNEELIRQLKVRQEQVCSINEAVRECTCELEAKRKHCDQVQSSIADLTVELKSKECHLNSIKKKIQERLKDLQSTEEQQDRLKASLIEHEKGLELREKELIAHGQKVQFTKEELAKLVEDCEVKAKQLSNFRQQSNPDLTPGDIHKPTGNSRKRGRYDDKSLSQSRDEGLDGAIKSLDHVLTSCTTEKENTCNFENQRSSDKFQIDQVWAIYSETDKGMPRKYAQIKRIDTSPEFKLHVAPLVLYRPPPNLMTHPVCCGRFKLKTGKAEVLGPSSFSHKVKAVKSGINRFEVYPVTGEIWALYKNLNCADETEEEVEIVEIVKTDEQSIQAMLLTAKVFNKLLYERCLESKAGVVEIPKTEVNRFSHQIPAFRRDRSATRSGECEWWELDPKAVLDLNSEKP